MEPKTIIAISAHAATLLGLVKLSLCTRSAVTGCESCVCRLENAARAKEPGKSRV